MKKEKSQLSGYLLIAIFVVPLLIAIAMYSNAQLSTNHEHSVTWGIDTPG